MLIRLGRISMTMRMVSCGPRPPLQWTSKLIRSSLNKRFSSNADPKPAPDSKSHQIKHQSQAESTVAKDWFSNRYTNTSFHAEDGLDPKEWALIYNIPISDQQAQDKREYLLYVFAIGATAFGIVLMVHAFQERKNPFAIGPALILAGIFAVTYAIRFRKYNVLRMYSLKDAQETFENWHLIQLNLPRGQPINAMAPNRFYRIVWKNAKHQKQIFDFDSTQTSDSIERPKQLARELYGNFFVKGRPWAVHRENFEEEQDYFIVRKSFRAAG